MVVRCYSRNTISVPLPFQQKAAHNVSNENRGMFVEIVSATNRNMEEHIWIWFRDTIYMES